MPEKITRKVSRLREIVNFNFSLGFRMKVIREHERGIANLEENCLTERDFVLQIGTLATLVDDFDEGVLRSCLKEEFECTGGISLLEKFLEENKLRKGNIIKNLRYIKRIRSTIFPIHRGTSIKFLKLMADLNFKSPFDWSKIWKTCLSFYINSLAELSQQLDEYNTRLKYEEKIEKRIMKAEKHESVTYLNDVLYKYRVLVPSDYKYRMETLVDYITAAVIAYDKNLKSINYALRKYVIPLKDKFREHTEDPYFIKKRRFSANYVLRKYHIRLSRDDVGIKDDKEFLRYFKHVYASVIAYQMGITPDWLIGHYWGSDWLGER